MKKMLLVLITVLCVVGFTSAQNKMSVGAGVLVSLPMGDFGEVANLGFGGTGAFEMSFMPQLVGNAQIGYITWGTDVDNVSFSAVPVLVGVKYFFMPKGGFYGLGQLGLTFMSAEAPTVTVPGFGTVGGGSVSSSDFTLVLGAGYELPVSPNVMLDFTGGFNIVSDANHITLRAGAKFGI